MKNLGSLIVISGPSGVGKSTLVGAVRANHPELEFSISCTTRSPRGQEQHGREYYFLTPEEFEAKVQAGEFLEYAGVFAKRYGTLKSEVRNRLENGKTVLLDIDVQGAMQIMASAQSDEVLQTALASVMILPPDLETLKTRLTGRNTDSAEQIALRLQQAQSELAHAGKYDYCVVNGDLEEAAADFSAILRAARCKSIRYAKLWEQK